MKLIWEQKQKPKGDKDEAHYETRLPDGSHLMLHSYGPSYGVKWWLDRYNCHGLSLSTLCLDAGMIHLDAKGHPVGDDPEVSAWLNEQLPLHALAALAEDGHTNEETS
jgi:hypothetical protein